MHVINHHLECQACRGHSSLGLVGQASWPRGASCWRKEWRGFPLNSFYFHLLGLAGGCLECSPSQCDPLGHWNWPLKYFCIFSMGKVLASLPILQCIVLLNILDSRIHPFKSYWGQIPLLLSPITSLRYFSTIFLIFPHKLQELCPIQLNLPHFLASKNGKSSWQES